MQYCRRAQRSSLASGARLPVRQASLWLREPSSFWPLREDSSQPPYPATPKLRRIDSLAAADSHVGNIARWLEGSATNPADRATLLLSRTASRRAAGGRDILWRHAAGRAGKVRGVFRRGESEAERLSGAGHAGAGDRVRQRISLPPAALEEIVSEDRLSRGTNKYGYWVRE